MKSLLLALLLITSTLKISAQALPPLQPEQDACGALEICGSVFYTPYSYSGPGAITEYLQLGGNCFGETNSVWLKLKIAAAGNIIFKIIPVDSFNDYDFAVWEMTGNNCNNIANLNNIRCNGNTIIPPGSVPAGIIGLNMTSTTLFVPGGTLGQPWCQFIAANTGDEYLIMVDNFSASASGFTIDFTGSTAIFDQGPLPDFLSETHTCDNSKLMVELSKPILCSSIAPDGSDFIVDGTIVATSATGINCSSPNGYTTTVAVQFGSSLSGGIHSLGVKNGTDNNTLLDLCGNAMPTSASLSFTMPAVQFPYVANMDMPACSKTIITLDHEVKCNTVANDGSDFLISGPQNVQVISAMPLNCNAQNLTDSIQLVFNTAINLPGNYTLSFKKGTDNNFITDTCNYKLDGIYSWDVRDDDALQAIANPGVLCNPGYIQLEAQPDYPMKTYQWTPGFGVRDSTIQNTTAYVTKTQWFYLTTTDYQQCTKRDTVQVIVSQRNPSLKIIDGESEICWGDSLIIQAEGGVLYDWWPQQKVNCSTCAVISAHPTENTTFYVSISDQYFCSDTLSQFVQVNPLPEVDAGNDVWMDYGKSAQLIAKASGIVAYTWSPGGWLNSPNIPNPLASPNDATTFTVTVIDTNHCYQSDSVKVWVNKTSSVFIPSAFSPNGDGKNDIFRMTAKSMMRITEFRIFNRWGEEIYQGLGSNSSWNGYLNGKAQPVGTYHYLIRVSWPSGELETFTGAITLIR